MRQKNTLEYWGLWEKLNNPAFKGVESAPLLAEAGSNSFMMSRTRWVELTATIGIKSHLIPEEITAAQASIIYAEEADVLNVAMFGMTAKQRREATPDLKGSIRNYAAINELISLSNIENINAVLINDGVPQGGRLLKLNQIAIQQMQVLEESGNRNLLK